VDEVRHRHIEAPKTAMSAATDKRIGELRATVREERAKVLELRGRVSADLRPYLRRASLQLTEVEKWLEPGTLRDPPRSDAEMARWLSFIEGTILGVAVADREWVENVVKKFGPDARIVGGR
jgi:hypothetical protein